MKPCMCCCDCRREDLHRPTDPAAPNPLALNITGLSGLTEIILNLYMT